MNIPTMFKKEERIHCSLGKIWNLVAMQQRRDLCYNIQTRKRAERSIARYGRKKHEAILDCPFRGGGALVVFTPPGLEDGAVAFERGGIGGSITSLSVRTGYGASAGGRYPGVMTCMRLPASTGVI